MGDLKKICFALLYCLIREKNNCFETSDSDDIPAINRKSFELKRAI